MLERAVAVVQAAKAEYPSIPPFHPAERYPELLFDISVSGPNFVYEAVRTSFQLSGLDVARFGSPDWNPLADLIRPGETVVLKPNLVKESHPRDPEGWLYVITHGSIIRAVADYVFKAVGKSGKVIVADAPQTDSSFEKIAQLLALDDLARFYRDRGYHFECVDLRKEEWIFESGVVVNRRPLAGDPRDYIAFDLADRSEFHGHSGAGRYYGADYDAGVVNSHHTGGKHEYLIAGTAIKCDVLFSLPKLKTHKKAGVTVSLKNLVGINGDKNWLPHHTEGNPTTGGDEFPKPSASHQLERKLVSAARKISTSLPVVGPRLHQLSRGVGKQVFGDTEDVVRSGNWWGNDTVWRMCLDLNIIAAYGNPDGTFRPATPAQRKRHFVLVDGIIAGQGRGPMNPDPMPAGLVLFGINAPSVDAASALLMGFDPSRIPIVREAFSCHHFPLAEWDWTGVQLISNHTPWNAMLPDIDSASTFHFEPHFGWKGQIERNPDAARGTLPQASSRTTESRL